MACTKSGMVDYGYCFTNQYFSHHDQQAIIVYRMAQFADSVGGSNYAGTLTTTLLTDSNTATCGLSNDQMIAAFIGIMSESVGATETMYFGGEIATLDQDTAAAVIVCLKNVPNRMLRQMQLYLACYLITRIQP